MVIKTMALKARQSHLELHCEIYPDVPPKLVGDWTRLRQILINLIGNAIKFTAQGEIRVSISVDESSEQQLLLHFVVADTGLGIARDKNRSLFFRLSPRPMAPRRASLAAQG